MRKISLREARARHRVSQFELRLRSGIHQSKISLLERGLVQPTAIERLKLAEALGENPSTIEYPKFNCAE